jgi:surface antigen
MTSWGTKALFGALAVLSASISSITPAFAQYWQCAPYAREISGIQIRGNANTWWDQAAGRYERGHEPKVGSVLALKSWGKMRIGHVAMVSQIVSDREVRLTHANWSVGGGIERNVRAIDVSETGDWSKVKVWYGPSGDLGLTAYPAYGFIYSGAAPKQEQPMRFAENRLAGIATLIDGLRN